MPAGLQVQNWFSTGLTGGAFEALTPGTGDSATFFNVPQGSNAYLAEVWCVDDASPMTLSLTASRFHDPTLGIVYQVPDGSTLAPTGRSTLLSSPGIDQPIYPSDVLNVNANGTAADNVNATLVFYYADIPGIQARLISYETLLGRTPNSPNNQANQVGIQVSVTPGAGDWGATVALNATDNRLHANADYAVMGFSTQTPIAAVALQGIDVGNLRVGGPLLADGDHDGNLFVDYARAYNAALIPVINSNNAGNILVQAADTAAGARSITVNLVQLSQ